MKDRQVELQQLLLRAGRYKTSHTFHLLMSVITLGFWIPVWILCALSNVIEQFKIDLCMKRLAETEKEPVCKNN